LAGYIDWGCCDEGQCEKEEVGECGEADGCHDCFLFSGDVAESALEGLWIVLSSRQQQGVSISRANPSGGRGKDRGITLRLAGLNILNLR